MPKNKEPSTPAPAPAAPKEAAPAPAPAAKKRLEIKLPPIVERARARTVSMTKRTKRQPRGPVVVLLHGMAVPKFVLLKLQWHLERKYQRRTVNMPFNTWMGDIPELAEQLAKKIRALGVDEFDAVTHSMGGVLLRWAMNHHDMPRLRRAVLIAPPNHGSSMANKLHFKLGPFYRAFWGPCALQVRYGAEGIAAYAGRLEGAEVGVIAGGSGTPQGIRNIFGLKGDNDRIVTVEETILPGMKDFVLLNLDHTTLILSAQTAHMANLFLEHGVFRPRVAGELPAVAP